MSNFIAPKSKLFAHLPMLHEIQQGRRPPPINVEVDLSNRCDLKCAGCHFAYTHTRGPWMGKADKPPGAILGGDLMSLHLASFMLRDLSKAGVKSITWTGGGEPTLHPDFDTIIDIANKAGFEQGIYSHGGHIRGERAAWMKQHFKWVYFSFDAHDVESYKSYKGVNRFGRVCENIRNLVALPGDATVGMGFLLNKGNVNRVHDMVRLGRSLGVDYVQFRPEIAYSQDTPNKMIEPDVSWILRAIGLLNAYKGDKFVIADTSRFRRYMDWTGHDYPTCFWSALQTVITPNGKVWRCTNKREHPDALLGDLSIESFATLWERSGGACQVNNQCRISCKGDPGNQMLDGIMQPMPHANFV